MHNLTTHDTTSWSTFFHFWHEFRSLGSGKNPFSRRQRCVCLYWATENFLDTIETLLDEKISDKKLHVDNYKIVRKDRNTEQDGGGCLIYITSGICYLGACKNRPLEFWWKIDCPHFFYTSQAIYAMNEKSLAFDFQNWSFVMYICGNASRSFGWRKRWWKFSCIIFPTKWQP